METGIDLVASDRITGSWTAIQCKFYEPHHYLPKDPIDSFFTASGKTWDGVGFDNRVIMSTTDKWSKHAEAALADQRIRCSGSVQPTSAPHSTTGPSHCPTPSTSTAPEDLADG